MPPLIFTRHFNESYDARASLPPPFHYVSHASRLTPACTCLHRPAFTPSHSLLRPYHFPLANYSAMRRNRVWYGLSARIYFYFPHTCHVKQKSHYFRLGDLPEDGPFTMPQSFRFWFSFSLIFSLFIFSLRANGRWYTCERRNTAYRSYITPRGVMAYRLQRRHL